MNAYLALADAYDRFTGDVDYRRWLRWYQKWFRQQRPGIHTVVDLGCGTGTLTAMLAQAGYQVIGVDASVDMLAQAMDKIADLDCSVQPLLLCQRMEKLHLRQQVDAVVCSLDCVNYITRLPSLRSAFRRVAESLRPGGLFLFDIIPAWEFARRDGEVFVDEDEGALCLWRGDWDARRSLLTYGLDLFQSADGVHWTREQEEHIERGWPLETLEKLLTEDGLSLLSCTGESGEAPCMADSRVFYVWKKENQE